MTRRLLLLGWLLAAVGCFDIPDFPEARYIDRPRMLGIFADPPEVGPDDGTTLSFMVVGPGSEDITDVRWSVCGLPAGGIGMGGNNQFGEGEDDRGCGGSMQTVELGEGERVTVPLGAARLLFENDALLRAALGANLPEAVLQEVRTSIGIAGTVEVQLTAGGTRMRGLKRVLVSENPNPGSNPPPPTFRLGDTVLRSQGDAAPYRCVPDDGPLRVDPERQYTLEPVFDGDEEPWLERYRVWDARGLPGDRKEQAFYSWFTDKGQLDDGSTRAPERNNSWRAPKEPGCARIWLVVRDGHAGQTACTADVVVGDSACE
jgi:hypothetical protein